MFSGLIDIGGKERKLNRDALMAISSASSFDGAAKCCGQGMLPAGQILRQGDGTFHCTEDGFGTGCISFCRPGCGRCLASCRRPDGKS